MAGDEAGLTLAIDTLRYCSLVASLETSSQVKPAAKLSMLCRPQLIARWKADTTKRLRSSDCQGDSSAVAAMRPEVKKLMACLSQAMQTM